MNQKTASERNLKLLQHDQIFWDEGIRYLAGVDEVGRGPLAGPVVAAAVIIQNPSFSVRIDDSKKLSESARLKAFDQILKQCWISLALRHQECIDDVNIYRATIEAMQESLELLPVSPEVVLVDGPMPLKTSCPLKRITHGDSTSLSIACASIVAKVSRDRLMCDNHRRYPEYGFNQHKGYGTPKHLEALKKNGPCRIHRKSFEPIASMVKDDA